MLIKNFSTSDLAAQQLVADLSKKLLEIKNAGKNSLLLLSGGSALEVLKYLPSDALGKFLTIGTLDERYDQANQNNNFIQITKTDFYRLAKKSSCCFIDTSVKRGQDQNQLAAYFEKELKKWKKQNKQGMILATLGMGADGHIAGIMPFPKDEKLFKKLFGGKNWIASYDAKDKNPHRFRITATLTFLKLIAKSFAFICGKDKKESLKKINQSGSIAESPARLLQNLKNISIYTDIKL